MNRCCLLLALAVTACGRNEVFYVAPGDKHVHVGSGPSLRSIDVDTLAEVGHATYLATRPFFSRDGSVFVAWNSSRNLVVVPVAGGPQVDLGPAADVGAISIDGTRVAFLRNPGLCGPKAESCAELFSAPSNGGEAVRVASGIPVQTGYDPGHPGTAYALYPYQFAGIDTLIFSDLDRNLMSVPADGSAPPVSLAAAVVPSPGDVLFPPTHWVLRDGRVVVRDETGLVLMDARAGARVHMADGPSNVFCDVRSDRTTDFSCPLSAAGSLAIVPDSTTSTSSVQIVSLTGGASFAVPATGKRMWFDSDGRFNFLDADGVLFQALPSGQVRQVGKPYLEALPGDLSPDGKWVSSSWNSIPTSCTLNCQSVQLFSTATAGTWAVEPPAGLLLASDWKFSPDSRSILVRSYDRNLYVAPVEIGGIARLIETDVDQAEWAGSQRIVINRTQSSPEGVSFVRVR